MPNSSFGTSFLAQLLDITHEAIAHRVHTTDCPSYVDDRNATDVAVILIWCFSRKKRLDGAASPAGWSRTHARE